MLWRISVPFVLSSTLRRTTVRNAVQAWADGHPRFVLVSMANRSSGSLRIVDVVAEVDVDGEMYAAKRALNDRIKAMPDGESRVECILVSP